MLRTAEVCQKVKSGVPLTMERCFSELTPPERFAIYDHVVERGKATNKTSSVKLEDLQVNFEKKPTADEQRPPSQLELKSQMRDYKRRRQSYRAKNVHITRKTYTEILKEVIENQTEYLKQLQAEDGDTADSTTRNFEGKQREDSTARPPEKDEAWRQPRASDSSRSQRESSVKSSSSKRRRSHSPSASSLRHESRHSSNLGHSRSPSASSVRHESRDSSNLGHVHRSPEQQEHKKHHRSHHHKSKHKHKHKTKDIED